jgi:large repetitive protein
MKIPQIGTSQVSPIKTGNTDIDSISQISISEISGNKLGTCQVSMSKNSTSQIGMTEASIAQIGSAEIGFNQVKKVQTSFSEVGSTQVNTIQDIFGGIAPITTIIVNPETTITQIDSTKISLPSSVSAVQLLNSNLSHDNTSLLTSIYSTARSIWHTNTDLNLTFDITNLPTGQLAEATITGYDTNGRPKTATINIDDDANGIGWYIDPTPQDHSEFATGTGTYFTAEPNSEAAGKYDLLNTAPSPLIPTANLPTTQPPPTSELTPSPTSASTQTDKYPTALPSTCP